MNNAQTPKTMINAERTKTVEVALKQMASKMSELCNQHMLVYLWKWFPPCRGLKDNALSTYLVQHGCGWAVVDKTTDPISGVTSIIYAFSRPKQKVYKAARFDFRAVNPDINKEQLLLEFGHVEIPFPADIKVVQE